MVLGAAVAAAWLVQGEDRVPTVPGGASTTGAPTSGGPTPGVTRAAATLRPFPAGDAWWTPVPAAPRPDPRSKALVALLADTRARRVANLRAFAVPVYQATAATPRHDVEVTRRGFERWGDNVLDHEAVPIPDGAVAAPGANGKLVVVDPTTDRVFDLWEARHTSTGWSTGWGGIYPLSGDGSSDTPANTGPNAVPGSTPLSRSTGSGVSSLAGVVRLDEIAAGAIPHALVFASDLACGPTDTGPFRWPATTTDGARTAQPCLPEGARVQLDPSSDLGAILGIGPGELAVGRALQTYGAYLTDTGGARMAFSFEMVTAGDEDPYPAAGLSGDYFELSRLPWDELQVLATWDGR